MKLNLPKNYLSYSAIHLWNENKAVFRKRYYENIKSPDTKYTLFGKTIEDEIYAGQYPAVPYWGGKQTELKFELNGSYSGKGIPLLGYLDSFDLDNKKFLDYKTGIKKPDNSDRWTKTDVQKLEQLPFYSMLIEKIYGKVEPVCNLIWLETELVKDTGLLQREEKLRFNGNFHVFDRKIAKWERKRSADWAIQSAEEISQDYTEYLDNKASAGALLSA